MVVKRYLSSSGDPTGEDSPLAVIFEFSLAFTVSSDQYLHELAWYRFATGSGRAPSQLRLFDATTQAVIFQAPLVPDSGAVGWQAVSCDLIIPLIAGREYRVSACWAVGQRETFYSAALTAPVSPFTRPATYRYYNSGACGFPGTSNYAVAGVGVDVGVDADPPSGATPPATPAELNTALTSWLDTVEGTQPHSAPLLDHATLATVNTNVSAVEDQQNDWAFGLGAAAHGYYADIKTLISNIKTITDTLPTPIAQLTSIVLDHYTADIDNILAQIDSVLSGLGAQSTDLSGTAGSAVGALSGRTGFPATGWTMSAETDFTDNVLFDQPADAYVLTIISYQPTQPATTTAAGLWLARLGWWCVMNGSLATQRQFVDFDQMLLTDQGRRMPACAIQLKPGTIAHVQAWLLA